MVTKMRARVLGACLAVMAALAGSPEGVQGAFAAQVSQAPKTRQGVAVVAVVNGEAITSQQLERRMAILARRLDPSRPQPQEDELRQAALEQLIEERLLVQAARRLGIAVGDEEVERALAIVAARNGIAREALPQAVQTQGMAFETYREELRRQLLIQRLRDRVTESSVQVTDAEVGHFLATTPELKRRFAEEAAGLTQTQVRHILIKSAPGVSDDKARAKLQALRERLRQGESFADLARVHSEDASAAQGGMLGWVLPGDFVPEFEEVMNALPVGEVSVPVKSRFGWHLIEVLARRPLVEDPEAPKNYARQLLRERKREQAFEAWLQALKADAVIETPRPTWE